MTTRNYFVQNNIRKFKCRTLNIRILFCTKLNFTLESNVIMMSSSDVFAIIEEIRRRFIYIHTIWLRHTNGFSRNFSTAKVWKIHVHHANEKKHVVVNCPAKTTVWLSHYTESIIIRRLGDYQRRRGHAWESDSRKTIKKPVPAR